MKVSQFGIVETWGLSKKFLAPLRASAVHALQAAVKVRHGGVVQELRGCQRKFSHRWGPRGARPAGRREGGCGAHVTVLGCVDSAVRLPVQVRRVCGWKSRKSPCNGLFHSQVRDAGFQPESVMHLPHVLSDEKHSTASSSCHPQGCGAVYGVLLSDAGVVALASHADQPRLHPSDLLLLATFLRANDSLRQVRLPICAEHVPLNTCLRPSFGTCNKFKT